MEEAPAPGSLPPATAPAPLIPLANGHASQASQSQSKEPVYTDVYSMWLNACMGSRTSSAVPHATLSPSKAPSPSPVLPMSPAAQYTSPEAAPSVPQPQPQAQVQAQAAVRNNFSNELHASEDMLNTTLEVAESARREAEALLTRLHKRGAGSGDAVVDTAPVLSPPPRHSPPYESVSTNASYVVPAAPPPLAPPVPQATSPPRAVAVPLSMPSPDVRAATPDALMMARHYEHRPIQSPPLSRPVHDPRETRPVDVTAVRESPVPCDSQPRGGAGGGGVSVLKQPLQSPAPERERRLSAAAGTLQSPGVDQSAVSVPAVAPVPVVPLVAATTTLAAPAPVAPTALPLPSVASVPAPTPAVAVPPVPAVPSVPVPAVAAMPVPAPAAPPVSAVPAPAALVAATPVAAPAPPVPTVPPPAWGDVAKPPVFPMSLPSPQQKAPSLPTASPVSSVAWRPADPPTQLPSNSAPASVVLSPQARGEVPALPVVEETLPTQASPQALFDDVHSLSSLPPPEAFRSHYAQEEQIPASLPARLPTPVETVLGPTPLEMDGNRAEEARQRVEDAIARQQEAEQLIAEQRAEREAEAASMRAREEERMSAQREKDAAAATEAARVAAEEQARSLSDADEVVRLRALLQLKTAREEAEAASAIHDAVQQRMASLNLLQRADVHVPTQVLTSHENTLPPMHKTSTTSQAVQSSPLQQSQGIQVDFTAMTPSPYRDPAVALEYTPATPASPHTPQSWSSQVLGMGQVQGVGVHIADRMQPQERQQSLSPTPNPRHRAPVPTSAVPSPTAGFRPKPYAPLGLGLDALAQENLALAAKLRKPHVPRLSKQARAGAGGATATASPIRRRAGSSGPARAAHPVMATKSRTFLVC